MWTGKGHQIEYILQLKHTSQDTTAAAPQIKNTHTKSLERLKQGPPRGTRLFLLI